MSNHMDIIFYYMILNDFDELLAFYMIARGNYFFELVLNSNFENLLELDCGRCTNCSSIFYRLIFKYLDNF